MTSRPPKDYVLIEMAAQPGKTGKQGANLIAEKYSKGMLRYAISLSRDSEIAKDITQEAWKNFLNQIPSLANSKNADFNLRFYLYRVVQNCLKDHYRKNARYRSTTDQQAFLFDIELYITVEKFLHNAIKLQLYGPNTSLIISGILCELSDIEIAKQCLDQEKQCDYSKQTIETHRKRVQRIRTKIKDDLNLLLQDSDYEIVKESILDVEPIYE